MPTIAQGSPLSTAENVTPATQLPHTRSTLAEGVVAACCPWPTGHVLQVAHAMLPVVAVNFPSAQVGQLRSAAAVGGAVWYVPAAHDTVAALHDSPSMLSEKSTPSVHAAHSRSRIDEPAEDWPWPTGQVDQAVHDELPSSDWKRPVLHAVHAASSDEVAASLLRTLPAPQAMQLVLPALGWYVPASHAEHALASSAEAEALFRCCPAAHEKQTVAPVAGWNRPVAHAMHAPLLSA